MSDDVDRAVTADGVADARMATLPKVELHVHLEGTISARTAADLAIARGDEPADVLVLDTERTDGPNYPPPVPRLPPLRRHVPRELRAGARTCGPAHHHGCVRSRPGGARSALERDDVHCGHDGAARLDPGSDVDRAHRRARDSAGHTRRVHPRQPRATSDQRWPAVPSRSRAMRSPRASPSSRSD